MTSPTVAETILRRHRQVIVHSFLYYKLGESIIPDSDFDTLVRDMLRLHREHLDEAKQSPYFKLAAKFEGDLSGFNLGLKGYEYPPELISAAFRILWLARGEGGDFAAFVRSYGYAVEGGDTSGGR